MQGLVDLDNEIAKCDKKLDLVRLNLQKIIKVESQPEYEETVPPNVRAANLEKVKLIFHVFGGGHFLINCFCIFNATEEDI
jgi:valyl-tRNA synthetase